MNITTQTLNIDPEHLLDVASGYVGLPVDSPGFLADRFPDVSSRDLGQWGGYWLAFLLEKVAPDDPRVVNVVHTTCQCDPRCEAKRISQRLRSPRRMLDSIVDVGLGRRVTYDGPHAEPVKKGDILAYSKGDNAQRTVVGLVERVDDGVTSLITGDHGRLMASTHDRGSVERFRYWELPDYPRTQLRRRISLAVRLDGGAK